MLCIETATEVCSVAISNSDKLLAVREIEDAHAHSAKLTLLIQDCAKAANVTLPQLQAIAISSGPGSYTALRVGISTAKGLCYALDVPLIEVHTLQALALATANQVQQFQAIYCPMIDARRMEVYAALFDAYGNPLTEVKPLVVETDAFEAYFHQGQTIIFSGNGAAKCQPILTSPLAQFEHTKCSAVNLIAPAFAYFQENRFVDVAYFEPNYGKLPNITTPKRKW
ncbi:MAG: tRNA (adenosine(37)-N6)-threonylcarbamoyltransferase complex dimerization subunit type 1 TsaB [Saprospiraceae bacterium]|nr:tRNA (adenosine(37)-N6)-threonylcarbamoyltransferase complex dimerization subunit type 1 TsaB [Saprospiraceae bacterium]